MNTEIDSELHIHLFGCLTAEDLWEQGQRQKRENLKKIPWFETEYEKAHNTPARTQLYLHSDESVGIKAIQEDIICQGKLNFPQFQSRFNFIIALYPDRWNDAEVLKKVCQRHLLEGTKYAEYKVLLPPHFSKNEKRRYIEMMAQACFQFSKNAPFSANLQFSLLRDPNQWTTDYKTIREWLDETPQLSRFVKAIDFCMDEQSDPPSRKAPLLNLIREDNHSSSVKLGVSLHIGECFDRIGLSMSAAWIAMAAEMGFNRLGHALALAPCDTPQAPIADIPIDFLLEYKSWLLAKYDALHSFGFRQSLESLEDEISQLKRDKEPHGSLEAEDIENIQAIQYYARQYIKNKGIMIECCPTSNFILSPQLDLRNHPLKLFLKEGINCVLASDDPGIFGTTLSKEIKLCREQINLTDKDIQELKKNVNLYLQNQGRLF